MSGLAQYSKFFENPAFTEIINEVEPNKSYIGSRFLPTEETYDIDFNETVLEHQMDMANMIDSGAELPLTGRDPVRTVSGEISDIGQSYIVTKKEMAALMDKGNAGKRKLMEKQLLGKAARVRQNIDARIEWLRWQALGNGTLAYNKGGIILGNDFGVPAENKVSPTTMWDGTSPTIIDNYEKWVQDYVDLNGRAPSVYITSIKVIRTVINDSNVRLMVTGSSDRRITIQELNEFLRGLQLPPMEAFDEQVTYQDPNNDQRVTQRLLSEKKGIFLVENGDIGSQLLGPTQENEMEPGIFGRTFTVERPQRDIVEVVAASYPKVLDPNLIKITTVLA